MIQIIDFQYLFNNYDLFNINSHNYKRIPAKRNHKLIIKLKLRNLTNLKSTTILNKVTNSTTRRSRKELTKSKSISSKCSLQLSQKPSGIKFKRPQLEIRFSMHQIKLKIKMKIMMRLNGRGNS